VTIVGLLSYTSGAQLCKGAAPIFINKPIIIKIIPKYTPHKIVFSLLTEIILYIESN